MTTITDLGVDDVNDEIGGNHGTAAGTVPATTPEEPDQPATPSTTGGVRPHDSGVPQSHILTEEVDGEVDSGVPQSHILTQEEG
ncbi:MAG TPA: hypothetical protein VGL06_12105 [Pseudonocardiaceae bacterium]|jgi:hypothetical protein